MPIDERRCLCCKETWPVYLFAIRGRGRSYICQDCFDSGRVTPKMRRLAHLVANTEGGKLRKARAKASAAA